MKKRKKRFDSDEYRAQRVRSDENLRNLRKRIEMIEAELAARGEKPRSLEYWLQRHEAERAAREQPST
jgi:hypothetical protein